ncbi:MAG: adenosylcobinamide-phosphate synthase CbiB [Bacillota bacterium]
MYILTIGLIADLIIGDPTFYPHPVVLIGRLIKLLENILYKNKNSDYVKKTKGILLVFIVLLVTFSVTYLLIFLFSQLPKFLYITANGLLLSTTIAVKGLRDSAYKIYIKLKENDLKEAKKSLSFIVSRDTEHLKEVEIIRGTIETVAENTSDGIIAPLFYFLIGGPLLAVIYKTVNTLDSMLGYKNDKYYYFGWGAAKLDDLANYIPARLTALLIIAASYFKKYDYKRSLETIIKDAKKHTSPNAGYPEAAVAGALGIKLGGPNRYFNKIVDKATLGESLVEIGSEHIKKTINLMYFSTFIFYISILLIKLLNT